MSSALRRPGSSSTSRTFGRSWSTRTPARPTAPAASSSRPSRPTTSRRSSSSGPNHKLERVSLTYPEIDGVGGKGAALRTIFEIAAALEVQALVVVDSDLRSIVPEWIELLSGPILKGGYDYVSPLYARYKYDGTITNTVTYPLTRALYGKRIRQPIGGDFGVSGDLVRHYLTLEDWTERRQQVRHRYLDDDVGADRRVRHLPDPARGEDPRSRRTRAPTSARCSARSSGRSSGSRSSTPTTGCRSAAATPCPAYGFERIIDPPPLEVNTLRLLSEFHAGSLTLADMWRSMLSPESVDAVLELAEEAGRLGDAARAKLGIGGDVASTSATTLEMAEAASAYHFPDDLWARVIYDLVLTARNPSHPLESLVAALVPIYFGRVGSFVIENRHITTEQAEDRVERQAREFELLKPYLVQRWNASGGGA